MEGELPKASLAIVTDPVRSALMGRVRQRGTTPELVVAREMRHMGLAYRKNVKGLPGSPDFANRRRRWAVFVQGCYWHHHRCYRGTTPARNRDFWIDKFATNRARDAAAIRALRKMGFRVVLIWECHSRDRATLQRRLERLSEPVGARPPGKPFAKT